MAKRKVSWKKFFTVHCCKGSHLLLPIIIGTFVFAIYLWFFFIVAETNRHSVMIAKSATSVRVSATAKSKKPLGEIKKPVIVTHIQTPSAVKAIYMTSWVAGTSGRERLIKLLDDTEANSVVIDIKDYTGKVAFAVEDPYLKKIVSVEKRISDIRELIDRLHKKNIYVIGRISVFQDPHLVAIRPDLAVKTMQGTVWKDRKGISWLDAGSKEVWDYTIAIAKESYNDGFDEINFDYIRFPSDGDMKNIAYPFSEGKQKSVVMNSFYTYLSKEMRRQTKAVISADLFGMTATNKDDLGIGQILENALANFDYVAPMVYPSHFPVGWSNLAKPAENPYDVIKISMGKAVTRASTTPLKLRPWLQDFNLGAVYTAAMVRAQIQAVYDVGLTSWMIWSPSNKYTAGALNAN